MKNNDNSTQIVFVLAIIGLCFYLYYNTKYNSKLIWVVAEYDKKPYLVQNKKDKQDAAELFAKLSDSLNKFIEELSSTYPDDNRVAILNKKFMTSNIREAIPAKNQTSYSINKGEKIVICIRTRDKYDKIVDFNTIMFVALHELSHVCTISIGHNVEFWDNFKWVLANAVQFKKYNHVNYNKHPQKYCKIEITDNPLSLEDMPKYIPDYS
jgi:hypothetical protein